MPTAYVVELMAVLVAGVAMIRSSYACSRYG